MDYRVVLVCNGEYKKTLHRCRTKETAFINFHRIKDENNVLFPKKFINTKGIKPVSCQICVTKPTEETDTFRTLRDEYGKLYTEKPLGDWTILHSDDYELEETFWNQFSQKIDYKFDLPAIQQSKYQSDDNL